MMMDRQKTAFVTTDVRRAGVQWTDGPEKSLGGLSIDSDLGLKGSQTKRLESSR